MIGYADVQNLEGERRELVQSLYERRDMLWSMPSDFGKIEAMEQFIADCERVGLAPLIASGLFELHMTLSSGALEREALTAFVRLMRHIDRYGDFVNPRNVVTMLNAVATSTLSILEDPTISLAQLERVIDLVEKQVRTRGTDPVGVMVARAAVAAARGDTRQTAQWVERWRAEPSEEWRADDLSVIPIEMPLIASFDLRRAIETTEQRLRMVGIDRDRLSADQLNDAVPLLAMLAFFRLRAGDIDEARRIADQLLEGVGIDVLARSVSPDYLIPILEHRADAALVVVDDVLRNLALDLNNFEALAALARNRLLADPNEEEARLLRALAEAAAAAYDERGGTDVQRRELDSFWWAGVEATPDPVIDQETWGDVQARALRILSAGWLRRNGPVREDRIPIALQDQYSDLFGRFRELLSTETMADTDELAAELEVEGEALRCLTTRFCVPLFHSLQSSQLGANGKVVDLYQRAQRAIADDPTAVSASYRAYGPPTFLLAVLDGIATPSVPWSQIEELIDAEDRIREWMGGTNARIHFARAEIAAHVGDHEVLREELASMQKSLQAGQEPFDRTILDLVAIGQAAIPLPEIARETARRVAEEGTEAQQRGAIGWLCWMDVRDGVHSGAEKLADLLDSVDGDPDELEQLPGWALLEGLAETDRDLLPVVESLLAGATEGDCTEVELFAAASRVLQDRAPHDPRGPELRAMVERVGRDLDDRNGNAKWSSHLHNRWLRSDRAFGARD